MFSAIFGFGGAFISLLISKWMAKMAMRVQVIAQPANEAEQWLVATVRRHAQKAGIGMPEVGIFDSPDPNAFATGASRKNPRWWRSAPACCATCAAMKSKPCSGHEIAHVANGDMVTLTLIQGVLNTFVIFLARVIGGVVDSAMRGNSEQRGPGIGYFVTVMVAQIVLGLFASMIVAWFSRRREFRADAGGAELAGTRSMIGALEALKRAHTPSRLPESMKAFGINGERRRRPAEAVHEPSAAR